MTKSLHSYDKKSQYSDRKCRILVEENQAYMLLSIEEDICHRRQKEIIYVQKQTHVIFLLKIKLIQKGRDRN